MKYVVGLMVLGLLVAHQDYWNWDNDKLIFGFLPHSIAYHCIISLAAAIVWSISVKFCWPKQLVDQVEPAKGKSP